MAFQRFTSVYKQLGVRAFPVESAARIKPFSIRNFADRTHVRSRSRIWRWSSNDSRVKTILEQFNEQLNILAVMFGKQWKGLVVQRLRRTVQIADLYSELYGSHRLQQFVRRLCSHLLRCRGRIRPCGTILLSCAFFSFDQTAIRDEEVKECQEEVKSLFDSNNKCAESPWLCRKGWEKVIDREKIVVWRRLLADTHIYEYKVYGTFYDVPARAFFDIQVDLNYRKQWDHLMVEVEVIDSEEKSENEVVRWIQHFPYPMYSREYVFVRRVIIDTDNQTMVLISRGVDHPKCPESKEFVRVKNYHSKLVLRPHKSIDENGFDYVLTYSDDPQAAIPSVAYNWMASAGVPDYCEKMHNVAKKFHENKGSDNETENTEDSSTYNSISEALRGNKRTMAA